MHLVNRLDPIHFGFSKFLSQQTNHNDGDFVVILVTIFASIYPICIIFTCCELGERLSIVYDQMDFDIGQFDWYRFPIEIQRLLPLVMMNAQPIGKVWKTKTMRFVALGDEICILILRDAPPILLEAIFIQILTIRNSPRICFIVWSQGRILKFTIGFESKR